MIDRQKLIGLILLAWSGGYIIYLLKARMFVAGPPIDRKEWIYFWFSLGGLILGTINVRMAAARLRGQKFYWPTRNDGAQNDNKKPGGKKKK
jgi:hypothetical protein